MIIDGDNSKKKFQNKDLNENKNNINIAKARKKKGRSEKPSEYGKKEIINIKNLKNQFKRSAKNYKLTETNELLHKTKIKEYNSKTNSYNYSYQYFHVPTINELNNKLYELHTQNFHKIFIAMKRILLIYLKKIK